MPPVPVILRAVAHLEECRTRGMSGAEILVQAIEAAPHLISDGEALAFCIRWFEELERTKPEPRGADDTDR